MLLGQLVRRRGGEDGVLVAEDGEEGLNPGVEVRLQVRVFISEG